MTTTIFDAVNLEFDQIESKRRQKLQQKLRQLTQAMSVEADSPPGSPFASSSASSPPPLPLHHQTSLHQEESTKTGRTTSPIQPQQQQLSLDEDDIPSWPADLLLEWWISPECYGCGPADCLIESELLRLGGSFLHTWQKKHVRLFPNRLEIYGKTGHGIPLRGAEVR